MHRVVHRKLVLINSAIEQTTPRHLNFSEFSRFCTYWNKVQISTTNYLRKNKCTGKKILIAYSCIQVKESGINLSFGIQNSRYNLYYELRLHDLNSDS